MSWDLRDARVVCRMLGFDGAVEALRSARFGQGSGRILLNWVNCDGMEDNLADCAHTVIRTLLYAVIHGMQEPFAIQGVCFHFIGMLPSGFDNNLETT